MASLTETFDIRSAVAGGCVSMTRDPFDPRYLSWLTQQIAVPVGNRTYLQLFAELHNKEFVWLIPNDDNRLADGLELRGEFFNVHGEDVGEDGASVLEVLIALSRRLAFTADGDPEVWAWRLIQNLELDKFWDPLKSASKIQDLDDRLEALIWRTYHSDGQGGFFPLAWPEEDQRKVELWYQMNAFIEEQVEL